MIPGMLSMSTVPRCPAVRDVPLSPEQIRKLRTEVVRRGKKAMLRFLRTTDTTYGKLMTTGASADTVARIVLLLEAL